MTKTRAPQIIELPFDIQQEAIACMMSQYGKVLSLHTSLRSAFSWRNTIQGFNYWSSICTQHEISMFGEPDINDDQLII